MSSEKQVSTRHPSATVHKLTSSSRKQVIKRKGVKKKVKDLIVLVAGTTDPINSSELRFEASWKYWDDNTEFRKKLAIFSKQYLDLQVFGTVSWSGDNSIYEREEAGKKLARLIKDAYPAWRDTDLSIHFIVHSHGGNVLHEATQVIAKDKNFPSKWKIKTILYLSTPFFNKLHQLNKSHFHKNCRIINVYSKYDFTQRVIADFSMIDVTNIISQFTQSCDESKVIKLKGESNSSYNNKINQCHAKAYLKESYDAAKEFDVDFYSSLLVKNWDLDILEARRLWQRGLEDITQVEEFLRNILKKINELNSKVITHRHPVTRKKFKRKMFTDDAKREADGVLLNILRHIGNTKRNLTNRIRLLNQPNPEYSRFTFISDLTLNPLIEELILFLQFETTNYSGPFLDLLDKVLLNQLDFFDNTMDNPKSQLGGHPYDHIAVDKYDKYHGLKASSNYDKFVSKIERWEKEYEKSPDQALRMQFIFKLATATNYKPMLTGLIETLTTISKLIDNLDGRGASPLVINLNLLIRMLQQYQQILLGFDDNILHAPDIEANIPFGNVRGDLMYLMKLSHSISRQDIYSEFMDIFKSQFDSGLNPGYKPKPDQEELDIIDGKTYPY